jgi:hypothetical protein
MSDDAGPTPVANDEMLARFILFSRWFREDRTIRPDAFIPHPYPDLSVTRHTGISETQLWQFGEQVAQETERTLYGRSDVLGQAVRNVKLEPVAAPMQDNPNHVNIVGWPATKAEQKSFAQKLAANASPLVPVPQE